MNGSKEGKGTVAVIVSVKVRPFSMMRYTVLGSGEMKHEQALLREFGGKVENIGGKGG